MNKVKELFDMFLKRTGQTQTEAASSIGLSQSSLSNKLARESLRVDDLLKLCEASNMQILIIPKDSEVTEKRLFSFNVDTINKGFNEMEKNNRNE